MRSLWTFMAGVLAITGCATEEIVVAHCLDAGVDMAEASDDASDESTDTDADSDADEPLSEASDEGGRTFVICHSIDDCDPDTEFCAKRNCQDTDGQCERRRTLCDAVPSPTCGCDGINYFNDCLRRANGIEASTMGECGNTAIKCGGPTQQACPGGPGEAYCAKLVYPNGPFCQPNPTGVCWVLPTICISDSNSDVWSPCDTPGPCLDFCSAIRSGDTYKLDRHCPP